MPKIKHIAIATQDIDRTAGFYKDVFGLREIAKLESANANGYFLSDGNVNMAILDFQNDAVAGERGKDYSGIHHIGFEVEDLEEAAPADVELEADEDDVRLDGARLRRRGARLAARAKAAKQKRAP